jgi:hypothetical protein
MRYLLIAILMLSLPANAATLLTAEPQEHFGGLVGWNYTFNWKDENGAPRPDIMYQMMKINCNGPKKRDGTLMEPFGYDQCFASEPEARQAAQAEADNFEQTYAKLHYVPVVTPTRRLWNKIAG